jgi:hypothetical protein
MLTVTPVNGNQTRTLITTTVNATSDSTIKSSIWTWFQATVTGTGAVTATVAIQGSNDNVNWSKTALATLTLSDTTSDSDGATVISPVKYIRAVVTNVTGTGASVTVTYTA